MIRHLLQIVTQYSSLLRKDIRADIAGKKQRIACNLTTNELSKTNAGYLSNTCVFIADFVLINQRGEEYARKRSDQQRKSTISQGCLCRFSLFNFDAMFGSI